MCLLFANDACHWPLAAVETKIRAQASPDERAGGSRLVSQDNQCGSAAELRRADPAAVALTALRRRGFEVALVRALSGASRLAHIRQSPAIFIRLGDQPLMPRLQPCRRP
jgi:hypothetical protein